MIHSILRDRICLLHYPPGSLMIETELAREFSVSRTPIRQALQRLEYEGLVETRNGVGTTVTGVDYAEFQDVYAVRLRLSEMIGDFSSLSGAQSAIERIDALRSRAQQLLKSWNAEEFWLVAHELHIAINGLISNSALREVHDRLHYQASRIWYTFVERARQEEVRSLIDEMRELRRALQAGDLRAVGFVQRNYVSYGLARVTKMVEKEMSEAEAGVR